METSNSLTAFDSDYASGLTSYDRDGLELFIHNDGRVYASQSAMARMMNTSEGTLRAALNVRGILPALHTQVYGKDGFNDRKLHGVATIVTLAKKYNPALMDKFAEMGANVYLYQLAGYKVGIQADYKMSEKEKNQRLLASMTQTVAIANYAEIHPNFQDKINFIVENNGALTGKMTLEELNQSYGYKMTVGQKQAIGRGMSEVTRKETGKTPTVRSVKIPKLNTTGYNLRQVKEYDVSLVPEYVSLCRQRGICN